MRFELGTFSHDGLGTSFAAMVVDGRAVSLADLATVGVIDAAAARSTRALLDRWDEVLPRLAAFADASAGDIGWLAVEQLHVHAPIRPRQVFCAGANYRKHVVDLAIDSGVAPRGLDAAGRRAWAEEMMDRRAREGEPYVFTKPVSSIAGPHDPIVVPATTNKLDWELELAVVIGRTCHRVPRNEAMEVVAGFTIANDLSARDLIPRTDYAMLGTDWLRGKGQPGFLPLGPTIVPAAFVGDPHDLRLTLTVADRVMQDESSADMLFRIDHLIEYLTTYVTLLPGDLLLTGSPAGNGTHHGRFLQPGDVMTGEIAGLGVQRATCVASPA
jgi:2,4-didehydro-3-deoxy-L-rhamnonate hydrolase